MQAPGRQSLKRAAVAALLIWAVPSARPQDSAPDPELEQLLAEERLDLARAIARGELDASRDALDEILAESPGDWQARALRLGLLAAQDDYPGLRADLAAVAAGIAEAAAAGLEPHGRAAAARRALEAWIALGEPDAAPALFAAGGLDPERDPRDSWLAGEVERVAGRPAASRAALQRGAELPLELAADLGAEEGLPWLAAKARCQRALGRLESASGILAGADAGARRLGGADADVLAELAGAYFEAYGEADDPRAAGYRPGQLFREALAVAPGHEPALLGLARLARVNWLRQSRSAAEWLDDLGRLRPGSLEGALARASLAIDEADWRAARAELEWLEVRAPRRREVRSERAALCFLEQDAARGAELLAELDAADPGDPRPELAVGAHLIAAYRFGEAVEFLRRASERERADAETHTRLGEALANVGDEDGARAALERATALAEGRVDVWRANTAKVLAKLAAEYPREQHGELSFCWRADEAPLGRLVQVPFYAEAREELALRYGFTPGPTLIEVFRSWEDFSVRSTGYPGFPGLGVCFGPVVTSISPLWERRGTNSWARTAFHEFTHVVHLGLSHNRCPRWLTEGLATWEEEHANPAWTRNMRRELLDAHAAGTLPGLRELNGLFRGNQVVFGYYLSGLLVGMWIEERGFPVAVRLLEAFDRGADLDQACREVLGLAPEEIDGRFERYVGELVQPLRIEPRWPPGRALALALTLPRQAPADAAGRARFADDWTSYAIASWQQAARADAEEGLRRAALAGGELPPRAHFLAAELALADGRAGDAERSWRAGLDAGGEDYLARVGLGERLHVRGELAGAEEQYLAAERDFPGFDEPGLAAELLLAALHEERGDEAPAMEARARWCAYQSGELHSRLVLAEWCVRQGRREDAARWYEESQEIDPFRRELQRRRGLNLAALGRDAQAENALRAYLAVPEELDGRDAAGVPPGSAADLAAELAARGIDSLAELGPADAGILAHALEGPEGGSAGDARSAQARVLALEDELERLGEESRAALARARGADVRAALAELVARSGRADEAAGLCREALDADPACGRARALLENLSAGAGR